MFEHSPDADGLNVGVGRRERGSSLAVVSASPLTGRGGMEEPM